MPASRQLAIAASPNRRVFRRKGLPSTSPTMHVIVARLVVPVAPNSIKPATMGHDRGGGEHQQHNEREGEREADGDSGSAHVRPLR